MGILHGLHGAILVFLGSNTKKRQTMADNVERPPDQFDFGSESTPGSDFGLTQGSLPNGARTPTRGPCRCGYKHWFDGIEYDYVFSFVEGKSMGFNDNGTFPITSFILIFLLLFSDNPQTAAGLYVLKYKLGGFNNTQIISQIAARIREALHEHRGLWLAPFCPFYD